MNRTLLGAALLTFFATLCSLASAQAGSPQEIRREAAHLFAKANEIQGLVHAHYRHADNFRTVDAAAHEFLDLTKHMKEHAFRATCDEAGLRDDLRRAERMFANLEHAAYRSGQYMNRHYRNQQDISRHIRQVLSDTHECLHEFGDALRPVVHTSPYRGSGDRFGLGQGPQGPFYQLPPRGSSGSSASIRIGNSNLVFRFGY